MPGIPICYPNNSGHFWSQAIPYHPPHISYTFSVSVFGRRIHRLPMYTCKLHQKGRGAGRDGGANINSNTTYLPCTTPKTPKYLDIPCTPWAIIPISYPLGATSSLCWILWAILSQYFCSTTFEPRKPPSYFPLIMVYYNHHITG